MPKLTNGTLEVANIKGTNFQYSGAKIESLGATEYTLVTIVADISGSVSMYKDDLEKCIKEIVMACRRSPRSDNLMIRLLSFNDEGYEEHGYKLLTNCNPDDYIGLLKVGGMTALYDATYNSLLAAESYGKVLTDNDFDVNGIIFVLTDGMDNKSTYTASEVKKVYQNVLKSEQLESFVSVLIGINVDPSVDAYLKDFNNDADFTQYVNIGDATEKKLARLAEFVSKSISSQSNSLTSGQASNQQSLTF